MAFSKSSWMIQSALRIISCHHNTDSLVGSTASSTFSGAQAILEIWTSPSCPEQFQKAPKGISLVTTPSNSVPGSGQERWLIHLIASSATLVGEAIDMADRPSSSISISAPVSSVIRRITLPPEPRPHGSCPPEYQSSQSSVPFRQFFSGLRITGSITSSMILSLPFFVISKASLIMS